MDSTSLLIFDQGCHDPTNLTALSIPIVLQN